MGFGCAEWLWCGCPGSPAARAFRMDVDRSVVSVTCSQYYALSHQTKDENADLGRSWSNEGLEGLADCFSLCPSGDYWAALDKAAGGGAAEQSQDPTPGCTVSLSPSQPEAPARPRSQPWPLGSPRAPVSPGGGSGPSCSSPLVGHQPPASLRGPALPGCDGQRAQLGLGRGGGSRAQPSPAPRPCPAGRRLSRWAGELCWPQVPAPHRCHGPRAPARGAAAISPFIPLTQKRTKSNGSFA